MASMVSSTGQSTWRRRDARRQPEGEPEVSRLRSRGRAEVSRLSRIYARCAPRFGGLHGTRRADEAAWSRKLFPREPLDEGRVGAIPTLPLSPCSRYEGLPMLLHSSRTRSRRPPPGARLSPSRAPPRLPAHRSRSRSRTLPPRPVPRSPRYLRPFACPPSEAHSNACSTLSVVATR